MGTRTPLNLSKAELAELRRVARRPSTPRALATRCRVIPLDDREGLTYAEIGEALVMREQAVLRWLNQVGRVFADLTEKQLRRGVFTSVVSPAKTALDYIDARNDDAQPFVWTADANTIRGRVEKNRAAISRSGHEGGTSAATIHLRASTGTLALPVYHCARPHDHPGG